MHGESQSGSYPQIWFAFMQIFALILTPKKSEESPSNLVNVLCIYSISDLSGMCQKSKQETAEGIITDRNETFNLKFDHER